MVHVGIAVGITIGVPVAIQIAVSIAVQIAISIAVTIPVLTGLVLILALIFLLALALVFVLALVFLLTLILMLVLTLMLALILAWIRQRHWDWHDWSVPGRHDRILTVGRQRRHFSSLSVTCANRVWLHLRPLVLVRQNKSADHTHLHPTVRRYR
jgi:hypothetical protein